MHKHNLLASNEDYRMGRYQLNSGVRYREPCADPHDDSDLCGGTDGTALAALH